MRRETLIAYIEALESDGLLPYRVTITNCDIGDESNIYIEINRMDGTDPFWRFYDPGGVLIAVVNPG